MKTKIFQFRNIWRALTLSLVAAVAASCADDLPLPDSVIGEGTSTVSASIEFEPLTPALESSRGTAGDAIKDINNLTLFVYDSDGYILKIMNTGDFTDYKVEKNAQVTPPADDPSSTSQAESTTCRATFKMELPYGRYLIYAVANMGDFPTDAEALKAYRTPDLLKKKTVEWNASNIASNNQMFGYLTLSGAETETSAGFDPTPVAVNAQNVSLHAWLKRAASKVTVVYDGKGLKNGVQIYIKSVTIHDIPMYCKIGENNTILDADSLIVDGESIYYDSNGMLEPGTQPDENYRNWMVVNRGNGPQGAVVRDDNGVVTAQHTETAQALYFYENLQGDYPGQKKYDKKQIWDEVGTNITKPDQPDYKDNIPYGTYIEVEAYYTAQVATDESKDDVQFDYISNGKIKYRFMLGQDVEYNYNAFRNHHYKLTLGFKGYANQPDWHIEYIEEDPYIAAPPIFYVPYTYHQKSMFPIRLIGNCTELTAEIIENNWAPYDPNVGPGQDSVPPALVGPSSDPLSFRWAREVYEASSFTPVTDNVTPMHYNKQFGYSSDGSKQLTSGEKVTPIWVGFLALKVPDEYSNPSTSMPSVIFPNETHSYSREKDKKDLKDYYYNNKQNIRTFSKEDLAMSSGQTQKTLYSGRNEVTVTKLDDGSTTVSMPMWTRAKTLLGISGFSGNNPYDTYQRKAVVRYTAKFDIGGGQTKTLTRDVPVYQVRRVVNPKGVWRKAADNSPFHVVLSRRENPEPTTGFEPFVSEGAWKATVTSWSAGAEGFITLSGGTRAEGSTTIYGNTGTDIDFTVNFTGQTVTGATKCAIITVEYHGYTCTHKIFVRQGYLTPITILGNAEWSSFSLYSCEEGNWEDKGENYYKATLTQNPLALGTFFKRGNYKEGILVKNNDRPGYGPLEPIGDNTLELANGEYKAWKDIWGLAYSRRAYSGNFLDDAHINWAWGNFKAEVDVNGKKETRYYAVPTYEQYKALETDADYAFGVMYADGATETAMDLATAYGFTDNNNDDNDGAGSVCGMRGVIVYNQTNAHQIFFPLGKNGIGRRTVAPISSDMTSNMMGYLRYGALTTQIQLKTNGSWNANIDRPIPYNLTASPGAIYWIKQTTGPNAETGENHRIAWDMNYFDMNFNSYDYAVGYMVNGDALPIRLVKVAGPSN